MVRACFPAMLRLEPFALSVLITLGCSGGGPALPGDGGDDGGRDPNDAGGGACSALMNPTATITSLPARIHGDLENMPGRFEVAAGACDQQQSWGPVTGPEAVYALEGLVPGKEYVASVFGIMNLALYVVTGCDEQSGQPGAGQCLAFSAADRLGELLVFTAPADGRAFLIVDVVAGGEPRPGLGGFSLDIYEPECSQDHECSAGVGVCYRRNCVECSTSFDCTDPARPACGYLGKCVASVDDCVDDDASEPGNDSIGGAPILAEPAPGETIALTGAICSAPSLEADYFVLPVGDDPFRLTLEWQGSADLDLYVYNATGQLVDVSVAAQPERLTFEQLTPGTYYARVTKYVPWDDTATTAYTLSRQSINCMTDWDCTAGDAPVCVSGICSAGGNDCTGEDAHEGPDDGPHGATVLTVALGETVTTSGAICYGLLTHEADWYAVDVVAGDNLVIEATPGFPGPLPLFFVHSWMAGGVATGFAEWTDPRAIRLTNLPAGRHYISLEELLGTANTTAFPYTLSITRTAGGCMTAADCGKGDSTQVYRGACVNKACEPIGDGGRPPGSSCDSDGDCASGLCSYTSHQLNPGSSVCTVACTTTSQCTTALGPEYRCTGGMMTNRCRPACAENADCGGTGEPDPPNPFNYYTCNPDGSCQH